MPLLDEGLGVLVPYILDIEATGQHLWFAIQRDGSRRQMRRDWTHLCP